MIAGRGRGRLSVRPPQATEAVVDLDGEARLDFGAVVTDEEGGVSRSRIVGERHVEFRAQARFNAEVEQRRRRMVLEVPRAEVELMVAGFEGGYGE